MRILKVKAPGSCGELAQGTLDGQNVLVTCPIDVYSEVSLTATNIAAVSPGQKTALAWQYALQHFKQPPRSATLHVQSRLLIGKGMASSSADISAAAQLAALWLNQQLSPDEVADIALAIEPTDGIFYPSIMLFDHVAGRIRQPLGIPPAMKIAILDTEGEINTVAFNQRHDLQTLNHAKEADVRQAIHYIQQGLTKQNPALIGQGATLSAFANQAILYKPHLEDIWKTSLNYQAAGITIAHSGTVAGILFDAAVSNEMIQACCQHICTAYPVWRQVYTAGLTSGGLWYQKGDSHDWISCF